MSAISTAGFTQPRGRGRDRDAGRGKDRAMHRPEDRRTVRVPVVMPLVEVDVDHRGLLTVTLDHEPRPTEAALTREGLKPLLVEIANEIGTPVRVEVREADRSTFTDIVTPTPPTILTPTTAAPTNPHTDDRDAVDALATCDRRLGDVTGAGFLPDEEVAVAVVVAHQVAGSDGTARLHLPPALLEAHPGLLVLLGSRSQVVVIAGGAA
ncbi:MAG: hypothetical protein QM572_11975 [Nocardioides sp.]|uniref:hypothetical protein n=1 Tax=Nocardioides sp. TaxID=35761 RepID=UPI0039E3B56E